MDFTTTIKYLDFISIECDRHLKNGNVSDDELNQLIIEYQRFLKNISDSNIPSKVKDEIKSIKFNYDPKKVNRGTYFILISILTFGAWGYVFEMRRQSKRKETLMELKRISSKISFELKLNS